MSFSEHPQFRYQKSRQRPETDRSLRRVCVVARARSKPPTIPLSRARTLTRAINHQRKQEQHAVDSSLLAAMAASDESPGGDGTMQGDELRAPLGLCRDASSARGVRDASSAHACRAVEWERGRGRGEAEAERKSRCAHLCSRRRAGHKFL